MLVDDQNFKNGRDVKKRKDQISMRESFFFFYQAKLISHFDFVPVFPYIALKERYLG